MGNAIELAHILDELRVLVQLGSTPCLILRRVLDVRAVVALHVGPFQHLVKI
jgi:hypothetical protein